MSLVDLLALACASYACLEAWFSPNSLLVDLRARTQLWDRFFWRKLFNCRFCLSFHVPVVLFVVFFVPSLFVPDFWAVLVKAPVYCLAATALIVETITD